MTTATQSAIDLTPITAPLLQLAGTLILAVGTWAASRLVQWLGLKNAAQATAALDGALQKAVTYGLQRSQDLIREKGWDNVEVRTAALSHAAPYMINRFADTLKRAGADMSNRDTLAVSVTDALDRAFPQAALAAAASPGTPPATAPNPPEMKELAEQAGAVNLHVDDGPGA